MNAPEEKIMDISEVFEYDWCEPAHTFDGFVCEECGEMTVTEYGRVKSDKKVCIDCAEK